MREDAEVAWPSLTEVLPVLNGPVAVRGYAAFGASEGEAPALDEPVLAGMNLYWWAVLVPWATRRGW